MSASDSDCAASDRTTHRRGVFRGRRPRIFSTLSDPSSSRSGSKGKRSRMAIDSSVAVCNDTNMLLDVKM